MNNEFSKLIPIWGISRSEANKLYRKYRNIEVLKKDLKKNDVTFLSKKDNQRLRDYFEIKEQSPLETITNKIKFCNSCKRVLPEKLDKGICPYCLRRTGNGSK